MSKTSVALADHFPGASEVRVFPRLAAGLTPPDGSKPQRVRLNSAGVGQLEPGSYVVQGRAVRPVPANPRQTEQYVKTVALEVGPELPPERVQPADQVAATLAQTRPDTPDRSEVLTGARGTRDGARARQGDKFVSPAAGHPTPREQLPAEQVPHARQEDARDHEQRSATLTGQATPVDPGEVVPQPPQSDYRDAEQRSATELGYATPIRGAEGRPPRQEDAQRLEQRSATATGTATPVPTSGPVEAERRRDSSVAKAYGDVPPHDGARSTAPADEEKPKRSSRSRSGSSRKAAARSGGSKSSGRKSSQSSRSSTTRRKK